MLQLKRWHYNYLRCSEGVHDIQDKISLYSHPLVNSTLCGRCNDITAPIPHLFSASVDYRSIEDIIVAAWSFSCAHKLFHIPFTKIV